METTEGVMDIREERKGALLIIAMSGRLDAVSSPSAERRIFEHINAGQIHLLLDFTGIKYLSSAGMRMLLSITKRLKALSGKLVVCSIQDNVMDILKMSGFDHVLEIAANLVEGERYF